MRAEIKLNRVCDQNSDGGSRTIAREAGTSLDVVLQESEPWTGLDQIEFSYW
jgi:hypothetical protein